MNQHVQALLPALAPLWPLADRAVPRGLRGVGWHAPPGTGILHLNPSLRWRALLRDIAIARRSRRDGARILVHLHGWSPRLAAGLTMAGLDGLDWRGVRLMALGEGFREALVGMGVPAHRVGVMGPCARSWDLPPYDPEGPWLYLGRLEAGKGVEQLLQATDRPVVIAGDGPLRPALEALARQLKVEARFVGWVNDPRPWLAAAAGLVLPSVQEGLPVSILEALGSQRPVVATAVGAIPEVLPTAVPAGDVDALRAALRSVEPVSQARAREVRGRYSPQAVAQRCVQAYRGLLATDSSG